MKFICIFLFIFINLYCKNIVAQNIVVIDIQSLIDKNSVYTKTIKEIEKNQDKYLKNFENKENELKQILKNIENSRLILSEKEINTQIDDYNKELNNFSNIIEEFNIHYQNQIITMRETIFKEIIVLLEKYAIENNIDLILDSTSYLIASNSIDITNIIYNELKKINIKLEYKNFEYN